MMLYQTITRNPATGIDAKDFQDASGHFCHDIIRDVKIRMNALDIIIIFQHVYQFDYLLGFLRFVDFNTVLGIPDDFRTQHRYVGFF